MTPSGAEYIRQIKSQIEEVDPAQVSEHLGNGLVLVDVREENDGTVEGRRVPARGSRLAVERGEARLVEPAEAIGLVQECKRASFDESVELHVRTGLNVRHADEQLSVGEQVRRREDLVAVHERPVGRVEVLDEHLAVRRRGPPRGLARGDLRRAPVGLRGTGAGTDTAGATAATRIPRPPSRPRPG